MTLTNGLLKPCSRCKTSKELSEFNKNKSKPDGLSHWCRDCIKTFNNSGRAAKYYLKQKTNNPHKLKEWQKRTRLKNRYNLTEQQYEDLKRFYKNECAICSKDPGYDLFVDHNHTTGAVRGLLCGKCNASLGWFESKKDLVLEYMEGQWQG